MTDCRLDGCSHCDGDNQEVVTDTCNGEWVTCLDCGYQRWPQEGQADLNEINDRREEYDLPPLMELRKRN